MQAIFVNIPCPTKKEAQKLCKSLLERELCTTTKIHENVNLMWKDKDEIKGEDVVLITLKTSDENI
ncbi:divalent cation tolerance protein CutA [Patescibacteria group bacterium]